MRIARYVDLRGGATAAREFVELCDQHLGIDDAAVADHARLATHDAARQRTDLVRVVADDDRVPGVRSALVAADDVRVLREQVDDLSLPLVAPLRPDDDGRRHGSSLGGGFGGCRCAFDAHRVPTPAEERAVIAVEQALDARRHRIVLSQATIAPIQWLVIFLLDVLILLTIAFVHLNRVQQLSST